MTPVKMAKKSEISVNIESPNNCFCVFCRTSLIILRRILPNHNREMNKACIFTEKKSRSQNNQERRRITAAAAEIYDVLLLNRIRPEVEKFLWKNQNAFRRNRYTIS